MITSNDFSPKYIDLFAGCGGLSLGLKNAGWKGVFAIEKDPMAFETLQKNFLEVDSPYKSYTEWPSWIEKTNSDIVELLSQAKIKDRLRSLRGSINLIAGGPPCQGFSVGGRRDGTDERNTLVYKMLEMVSIVRPDMVLIENVEGITRRFVSKPGVQPRSTAELVIEQLESLGYSCTFEVVEAQKYGVPQSRKRVAIVGALSEKISAQDLADSFRSELAAAERQVRKYWKLPVAKLTTAKEAIHDLQGGELVSCPDSPKFLSAQYTKPLSAFAKAMRRGGRSGKIPNSHRFSNHGERISNLYKLAHETQPPGRLSKKFLIDNGTKKDKKVLIDPDSVVSTITTHPDEFIHYLEHRNITVREMARFQSFPDDFHFYGRYTINGPRRKLDVARCSQVGNAVPPLMAQGVAHALREILLNRMRLKEKNVA